MNVDKLWVLLDMDKSEIVSIHQLWATAETKKRCLVADEPDKVGKYIVMGFTYAIALLVRYKTQEELQKKQAACDYDKMVEEYEEQMEARNPYDLSGDFATRIENAYTEEGHLLDESATD